MWNILKTRGVTPGVDPATATIGLTVFVTGPAWAFVPVPGPAGGGLAGAAILGALIVAKWWRRK